jgi:hypothetical protein
VPASIKLQEEYGDDLAVIFVESQGATKATADKFVMKHRWLGNQAMWTLERPVRIKTSGLPSFALISADGKIISTGNHMTSRDKDLLEEEVNKAKSAPEGTHKSFKKAWKEFSKGNYAKALTETKKVGAKKTELAEEAAEIVALFEGRIQGKVDRGIWLLDNGYPVHAKKMLSTIETGLKGTDDLLATVREVQMRFETDEMKLELKAADKIDRLLKKVYEDGRDEKLFIKLEKMAEDFSGTRVAERAQKIASLGG